MFVNGDDVIEKNGADDVKRHRWFKGLDWEDIFYRKLKVLIIALYSHSFELILMGFYFKNFKISVF